MIGALTAAIGGVISGMKQANQQKKILETSCEHEWIANSGKGGKPEFKIKNMANHREMLMRVQCGKCGGRLWMSEKKWRAAAKAPDPAKK